MSAAEPSPATQRRPRLRFTLGGMFVGVFGIAVGLAWWRVPGATFPHALLASFSTWFLIGLLQRLWRDWGQLSHTRTLPGESRRLPSLKFAGSVGLVLLVAIVAAVEVAIHFRFAKPLSYVNYLWTWARLVEVIYFLAILLAYGRPSFQPPPQTIIAAACRSLTMGLGLAFAGGVLGLMLANETFIIGLVHVAIRGVEMAQPTRWAGQVFNPARLHADRVPEAFIQGSIAAISLQLGAILAGILLVARRPLGRFIRGLLLVVMIGCLAGVAWLVSWCAGTLLPDFSPFMAESLGQPPGIIALALVAIAAGATALALWHSTVLLAENPFQVERPAPAEISLYEHPGVLAVGLVGIAAMVIPGFGQQLFDKGSVLLYDWRPWIVAIFEYAAYWPHSLIQIAVAIVLGQRIWCWWQGTPPSEQDAVIDLPRFAAIWLVAAFTLAFAVPVLIWFGTAMTLRHFMS